MAGAGVYAGTVAGASVNATATASAPAPSPTYKLHVTASELTGTTGHHKINCHIEETDASGNTIRGIPESWGIEWQALRSRFGGGIDKWREWVAAQMLKRHIARSMVQAQVSGWKGRKFDIVPPEK